MCQVMFYREFKSLLFVSVLAVLFFLLVSPHRILLRRFLPSIPLASPNRPRPDIKM